MFSCIRRIYKQSSQSNNPQHSDRAPSSTSRMSSILLIGGNGQLARHITKRFSSKGITVHSVIRNQDQVSELTSLGASPILQSVEDSSVSDFVKLIKNLKPSTVIWSAGAGAGHASPSRVKRVDHEGHIKVIDAVAQAAKEAGTTKRYITVSALDVRDKDNKPVPDWYDEDDKKFSKMIWGMMGTYMRARYASDKSLVEENGQRGLDYTIVRPGWLSQDPGTGNIAAGKVKVTKLVSREDVTAVVELCMKNSRTVGLAFDVAGGDVLIEEAVDKAADTFEGFH